MISLIKKISVDFSDREIEQLLPITEEALSQFLDVSHSVLNASGLSSLQAALYSVGVGKDDEVICDAIFPFAMMAILNCGAIPVPVDLDFETLTMSPEALEKAISSKTKAVIATAVFGIPPNTEVLQKIIKQRNLPLIEDHAQAFGVTINGISSGSRPDLACYSFQSGKPLSCGFGGAVATSNPEFDEKIRRYISLGWFPRYNHLEKLDFQSSWIHRHRDCQSLRLSPIAAGLLLIHLQTFEEQMSQQITSVHRVENLLTTLKGIHLQKACEGYNGQRWRIAVITENVKQVQLLVEQLRSKGSYVYSCEHPPVTEWPCFINSSFSTLPITRKILDCLMLFPVLNEADANREIAAIKEVM